MISLNHKHEIVNMNVLVIFHSIFYAYTNLVLTYIFQIFTPHLVRSACGLLAVTGEDEATEIAQVCCAALGLQGSRYDT